MIVTIDGPAGSGKSTAARLLAQRLGVAYLDTGAMYRAVALAALRRGINLDDPEALGALAARCDLHVEPSADGCRVRLDGEDVTAAIRTAEVNEATARVARAAPVRRQLVAAQQTIGRRLGSLVTEGRDQGTVVFPDADVKVFLDADVDCRARRRFDEMTADGQSVTFDDVRANLALRDRTDRRQWTPLLSDPDAIRLDTTGLTIEQVVEWLFGHVTGRPA